MLAFAQTANERATRRRHRSMLKSESCVRYGPVASSFVAENAYCADVHIHHKSSTNLPKKKLSKLLKMAVPFSKPAYNAHYRARQARAQAQQQQQQQQNQQNTITRFLDGNGGMRLDQLSLTSRIAFYALYEAYRLLVDLTNTNQQQNPQQQQQQQPQHTVVNSPHAEQQERRREPEVVLPDLIPQTSADSTQSQFSEVPRVHLRRQNSDKWIPEQHRPDLIPENDDTTDFGYPLPDFVPGYEQSQKITREDLEIKVQRVQRERSKRFSTSSDYFSLDGSLEMEDDQSSEGDFENSEHDFSNLEDIDETDSTSNEKCEYVNKGINWHNLGNQLCEIASAFEVSYAPYANMTEQQRHIYQVYKDLKIKSLALSRRDKTMVGLARTICRQLLLSTIWTLLRKIM